MKRLKTRFHLLAMSIALVSGIALADNSLDRGEAVYERECLSCHGPGRGNPGETHKPGTSALLVKYNGQLPALLTERTDLAPEYIRHVIRNGISLMAHYRKTEISDDELEDLVLFLTADD